MKLQEKALLHALLTHSTNREELLRFLPPPVIDEIERLPIAPKPDFSKLFSQSKWLEQVHFSWFSKELASFDSATQPLFLSLLSKKQLRNVCTTLNLSPIVPSYSTFMRPFLRHQLIQKLQQGDEILNEDFLPPAELNILLTLSRRQLLNMVDLLAMHDLSADLRQIVDKELLGSLYAALTSEQLRFLHYCSKLPMKWIPPKLNLLSWDRTKSSLQRMLHSRGLSRLARALSDEDRSLKWHILHRLDVGRAKVIEKIFSQTQDSALIPYFKNQVLHIAKRYPT